MVLVENIMVNENVFDQNVYYTHGHNSIVYIKELHPTNSPYAKLLSSFLSFLGLLWLMLYFL